MMRAVVSWLRDRVRPRQPSVRTRMRDIRSGRDCVRLLQHVGDSKSSTDNLIDILVSEYTHPHPPTETELQRLSILHQRAHGTHGDEEFAVVTLYTAAMVAIMDHAC
jgi:hypothetical protein